MSDDATRVLMPNMPTGATGTFDRTMVASGATMQMPVSGLNDPYRTQMGGTTTCPVCKSTTPLMEIFCGECGYLLSSPVSESLEVPLEEVPVAELVAEADGKRHKLRQGVNTLGRQGTDVLVNEGTISRVHAQITIEGDTITVEDLGSTNGTKVGDLRIGPNQPTVATPGTLLRFGSWKALLQSGGASADARTRAIGGSATLLGANRTIVGPPTGEGTIGLNATRVYQSGELNVADALSGTPTSGNGGTVLEPAVADGNAVARLTPTSGPGVAISLTEGTITIGRRPGNSIVITNDSYISGRHSQIETDGTGTYLTDLGSTNGSRVNGQKLTADERQLLLEGDEVQLGQTKYQFVVLTPESPSVASPASPEAETGLTHNPDGSPPGQEFGAINDPVYPPSVAPHELNHAVDNEMPN